MSMVNEHIHTVMELLLFNGYPASYIKGHHSRMILDNDTNQHIFYIVYDESDKLLKQIYQGYSEYDAVKTFINNEEKE